MPQFAAAVQSIGIVFDSDMGNDPDAALTLALLNGLEGKNECRVISLSTTKTCVQSAAFLDVVTRFYMSATTGLALQFRPVPGVGMNELGWSKDSTPMLKAVLAKPDYTTGVKKLNDTAEPHALIRNMLTAQQKGNAAVLLDGPATNLVRTMELQNAVPLIQSKVRYLVVCTDRLKADLPAARKLLATWPTPIIAAGPELGTAIKFPATSLDKDFAWSTAHPVVDAVRGSGVVGDIPATAMVAALYAVRAGKDSGFQLSEPGKLSIGPDGRVTFALSADGTHKQLAVDPAAHDAIVKTFVEMASAKPVVRTFRRRPDDAQKADEKKADSKKPEDKKLEDKKPEDKKPEEPPEQP